MDRLVQRPRPQDQLALRPRLYVLLHGMPVARPVRERDQDVQHGRTQGAAVHGGIGGSGHGQTGSGER